MKNWNHLSILIFLYFFSCNSSVENAVNSMVLSHNDYAQIRPFTNAYNNRVGFIEADVYLRHDSLLVAHEPDEIVSEKTLENLYLDSLAERIKANGGTVYPDANQSLVLMIDLKTEGAQTIPVLIRVLISYPNLVAFKSKLKIVLSGSVPSPAAWNQYPDYLWFDGRPTMTYTSEALKRVAYISTNFKNYSQWDGIGIISKVEDEKILSLISQVHAIDKPLRFWATPDTKKAWAYLLERKVDILGTDNVSELCLWLANN